MTTPIGRGGSCETSMRLYPPCNPIGVGPTKPPCSISVILLRYRYYIVIFSSVFFMILGLIIPIGRDGLCETSMRHYPSRNSIRHWTHKTLFIKPRHAHYLQYCCNYCPFFYFDLGMKTPNGLGGFR